MVIKMIKGIGIDIVEIERLLKIEHLERFIDRVLAHPEQDIYYSFQNHARRYQFLAGRFAAKEAYSKAIGTGIGELRFTDIVILNDTQGKPYINIEDKTIHLSISHSDQYAVASVVIEE
jgi:holo-[acyl-carrier protein] synthase